MARRKLLGFLGFAGTLLTSVAMTEVAAAAPDVTTTLATPIVLAIGHNSTKLVDLLVAAGAKLSDTDEYGQSLLHIAVSKATPGRKPELVSYLMDKGIDPNSTKGMGEKTPLMLAAAFGNVEVVKLLMARGADTKAKDRGAIPCSTTPKTTPGWPSC